MPHPLAVGLFHLPANALAGRRRRARIEIALRANREGYALLDTFDTSGPEHGQDDALNAVRVLTEHHDLHAVLLLGDLDQAKVDDLVIEHSLITLRVDEARPAPPARPAAV